jgi:hypothetical protein
MRRTSSIAGEAASRLRPHSFDRILARGEDVTDHHRAARLSEPLAFGAAFFIASAAAPAWAYLDPGTGSMMLQLMLGGVAGAIVIGKLYLKRATDFFRSLGGRRRPE